MLAVLAGYNHQPLSSLQGCFNVGVYLTAELGRTRNNQAKGPSRLKDPWNNNEKEKKKSGTMQTNCRSAPQITATAGDGDATVFA